MQLEILNVKCYTAEIKEYSTSSAHAIKIVNNHPLTKNKPIYHARISHSEMARFSTAISSVYNPCVINRLNFGQWVVIYFIMQLFLKLITKIPTSSTPKRDLPLAILFILITGPRIARLTKSSTSPP